MLRRAEEWRRRRRKIFVGDRKYLEKENSWSAEKKNKEVKAGNYLKKNYQMMMSAENQSTDNQVTM